MKTSLIEKIRYRLKQNVSSHRYEHSLGVANIAIYLANKHNVDEESAHIAALLHDYAKEFSKEQVEGYISKNNLIIDEIMSNTYQLLHGKIAAHIAKKQFDINNDDILNAIEYHTTGRKKMSKLEKIIYIADFMESATDHIDIEKLKKDAKQNLNKAVLLALDNTIKYVVSTGKLLHTDTVEARNTLLLKEKYCIEA